jgi:hypothetical protein
VKALAWPQVARWGILGYFILASLTFSSTAQTIRLRNELIAPRPENNLAAPRLQAVAAPASGLYLVRFTEMPSPEVRVALAESGVDLLHYVPDNAFLARFKSASVASLQTLAKLQWVGEYRPDHKLHSAVRSRLATGTNDEIEVSVLLAPRVAPLEIAMARRLMMSVRQESTLRWGTMLRGRARPSQVLALSRSDAVLWLEPGPKMKLYDEVASKIVAGDGGPNQLLTQSLGYDGSGVGVAVADSGLNNGDAATMHPDLMGRTPAFFYYGALTDAADEHSHGTHVAGIVAGNGATGEQDANGALYGLGVAPGANIIAQRIFDGTGNYEAPPSYETLTRDAMSAGGVIGSNSWGDDTQGRYDTSAMEFDALVRDGDARVVGDQQYILEFSAGNAGPAAQTIGSPAVAKNVIATGASENDRPDFLIYGDGIDAMADFSSRGPCEDGRIKPDVVAPGTWIASLQSQSATDQYAWAPISTLYQYQGGTSQAGPHASGAAAVFVQYYRMTHANATPSPALVKAALINCSVDMDDSFGTYPTPNMDEGWGRIDLPAIIDSPRRFEFTEQGALLGNGQAYSHPVIISASDEPLKVTLVYTDPPGFPGALAALVNDLDLEVTAPDGRIYHGNQFNWGESVPNAVATDSINNVEGVHIYAPLPGEYGVRVIGRRVVADVHGNNSVPGQDFALVVSGAIAVPHVGSVSLDRKSYTAPDRIRVTVIDSDLAGQSSASVFMKSTTETVPEMMLLNAVGTRGVFTGAVVTATGPALQDGKLQVANRDSIEVGYLDASSGQTNLALAAADLVAPLITGVSAVPEFGQVAISWTTDEPATSVVYFNTNSTLNQSATDGELTSSHSVTLSRLLPGRTYYFKVASADEAGNIGTNNNNGALFSFVAPQPNTVLLVDNFIPNGLDNDIPLSVYTDGLAALGVSYDVWDIAQRGSPTTNTLRPYRVVIWRFNDGPASADTLSVAEENTLAHYLQEGGAFFMASMEQLTRLGAGAFRRDVLHVSGVGVDAGVPGAYGLEGDSISSGMDLLLEYSQYDNFFHQLLGVPDDISDTMILQPEATPFLSDSMTGHAAGMSFPHPGQDSAGRVVFLSFPLDAVSASDPAPDNRVTLLGNILKFLVPGLNGHGTVALDAPAYGIPSACVFEVGDTDLSGQGTLTLNVYSSTQTNGMQVTLRETSLPGLFRGSFEMIATNNPPTSGKVRVKNGDQVWVDYFDASSNAVVRASANVDTSPPDISGVNAEPDYVNAVISWTTSEPSDSLVQFGESALLNRSAYDPGFTTVHQIFLGNLLPDRTYYFEVASRDRAGNIATDDNTNRLYKFTTRNPLRPDWSDDMETGATNWTTYASSDSQTEWLLGTPKNMLQSSAHSGVNAWGCNLNYADVDTDELFLISPAIYLTGGNVAKLRFYQSYNFQTVGDFDILEYGQVLLLTNNATTPVTLAAYSDDTVATWEEVELDLTPYVGQVIYLVWNYELFSFDSRRRDGWLIDDVSVTVSNIAPGILRVSNNIAQAGFSLTGPVNLNGGGRDLLLTNAPPGQYVIQFHPVPWYATPAPQTNTLASGGAVAFGGLYTIVDANKNGIADSWETNFFGSVSTNRTASTDTDGDGVSDYAEFVAGTDPTNPQSVFKITSVVQTNGIPRLTWFGVTGREYRIDESTNLAQWQVGTNWTRANNNGPMSFSPVAPGTGARYYRLEVRP